MTTTGMTLGENISYSVVPTLKELCIENIKIRNKHVERDQLLINNPSARTIKFSPFRILTCLNMRTRNFPHYRHMLEEEAINELMKQRPSITEEPSESMTNIQEHFSKITERYSVHNW